MRYDYKGQPKDEVPACPVCGTANPSASRVDRYGCRVGLSTCACGLAYLNPQMTAAAYAAFYQGAYRQLVALHEQRATDLERTQQRQREYGAMLARRCPEVAHAGALLDAGGSTGAVAEGWQDGALYSSTTVLDPSVTELQLANGRGYATMQGMLEDAAWGFGPEKFHVVLCAQTIDHVQDPIKALQALRTVTRPNGWLVLDYVVLPMHAVTGQVTVPQIALKIDHPCYWTKPAMHRALAASRWDIASSRAFPHGLGQKGLVLCRPC